MQEIFPCPACGARNYIGQEFCQACGQRFQYNCPHCGTAVDATLVNCPRCRESLYWPKPQKVKPFLKEPVVYQRSRGGGEGEGEVKEKPKSDPWLTGCLGLVIIAILAMVAYFVYDNFIKQPSPAIPGEMGFNQMQYPESESLQIASIVVYQRNEMQE